MRCRALALAAVLAAPGEAASPAAELPWIHGKDLAPAGAVTLHAKGAPVVSVLHALDGPAGSWLAVADLPITGRVRAENRPALVEALSRASGVRVLSFTSGGAGKRLTLDVPLARASEILRAASGVSGPPVVFDAGNVPDPLVAGRLFEVPAEDVIRAVAAALGAEIVPGRDLRFLVEASQPGPSLSRSAGERIAFESHGATAPDLFALLAAAAGGEHPRLPCDVDTPLFLETRAALDETIAAVLHEAAWVAVPDEEEACSPPLWEGDPALEGTTPIARARASSRNALLVRDRTGGTHVVVDASLPAGVELVAGGQIVLASRVRGTRDRRVLAGWPQPDPMEAAGLALDAVAEGDLVRAALLATVTGPRRKAAILRIRGAVVVLPGDGSFGGTGIAIEDGLVRLTTAPAGAPHVLSVLPAARRETEAADESGGAGARKPFDEGKMGKKDADHAVGRYGIRKDEAASPPAPREGTRKQEKASSSNPPKPGPGPALRASGSGAAFQAATDDARWAVEPFGEKAGWMGPHQAALAAKHRGESWGDSFALAVEAALREKGRAAQAVPRDVTAGEIPKLVEEGLRYLVDGELRSLSVDGSKTATLAVSVRLRRQASGKMRQVQMTVVKGELPLAGTTPTDVELLALFGVTARNAAAGVLESIPQDLLAGRN